MIASVNPATEQLLAEFEPWSDAAVDEAVDAVHAAQRTWARTSVEDRGLPMRRAARSFASGPTGTPD